MAALGLVACGGSSAETAEGSGSIELSITGPGATALSGALRQALVTGTADAAGQIKSVWVNFECPAADCDPNYYGDFAEVWAGTAPAPFPLSYVRTRLPPGTYTVTAYAASKSGNLVNFATDVLFKASAQVVVTDRNVSNLSLIMQQEVGPETVDIRAPHISGIAITGTFPPVMAKPVGLLASVVNTETTGTLSYAWAVACPGDLVDPLQPVTLGGQTFDVFTARTSTSTNLTLSGCEGDATVTFTVTASNVQGAAGPITSTVSFVLKYVPQGINIGNITINPWPNITALRATTDAQPLPGQTVDFVANAVDPDGGPVAYTWTAMCGSAAQDVFEAYNAENSSVKWTAPATAGSCTIKVSVTDGEGGSNSATFTLNVGSIWTAMPALYPDSSTTGSTITWNADGSVTLTKVDPATAPNLSIVGAPQKLATLSFDVGGDGYCGAGAPRFNVRFQGSSNLYWFACAYGTRSGSTVSFVPVDAFLGGARGVLPEDLANPISSIGIVMDEVGSVTLSNIRINGSLVTH